MRLLLLYHDGGCEKPAWGKKAGTFLFLDGSRLEKVAKKRSAPPALHPVDLQTGNELYGCASGGSSLCRSARILRISTSKPCCEGT